MIFSYVETKLFDHYIQMAAYNRDADNNGITNTYFIASNLNIQRKIRISSNITRSLKLSKVLEALINFDYLESLDESRDRK